MVGQNEIGLIGRRDVVHIAILEAIALAIGVYLIATTVLIAKDGVYYIERAQQLTDSPENVIKAHPPGYPFLIMAAHNFAALFADDSSVFTWIYSAQAVTLLCRLLALIPLYLMGRFLVGSKNSFWAMLIFIFLPFPTKLVCDVVREWPYLLFLSTGFFFLLWGAKNGKWWAYGFVGLSSGLGYLIRHESAQLIFYGFVWIAWSVVRSKLWGVPVWKKIIGLALLLVGFAIPAVPYMKCTGKIIPPKVNSIMNSFSFNVLPDEMDISKVNTVSSNYVTAEIAPPDLLKALGEIFKTAGESLMWFFMPALLAGFWCCFRRDIKYEDRFLITAFVLANITMMVLQYCYCQPHISQRWSLPLVVFTVFYIPVGLSAAASWFESRLPMNRQSNDASKRSKGSWFLILVLVGAFICMPKLFRPVSVEKHGYRKAANWLMQNSVPADIIAVKDKRISFYAERKGIRYAKKIPKRAKYAVGILNDEDQSPEYGRKVREKYSVWVNKREKKKRLVIYEVP
ncbi:MAG: ArnT family glycosyltransferase [Planctomycetota bacterium]